MVPELGKTWRGLRVGAELVSEMPQVNLFTFERETEAESRRQHPRWYHQTNSPRDYQPPFIKPLLCTQLYGHTRTYPPTLPGKEQGNKNIVEGCR